MCSVASISTSFVQRITDRIADQINAVTGTERLKEFG